MPQILSNTWIENYTVLVLTLTLLTIIYSMYYIPNNNKYKISIINILRKH